MTLHLRRQTFYYDGSQVSCCGLGDVHFTALGSVGCATCMFMGAFAAWRRALGATATQVMSAVSAGHTAGVPFFGVAPASGGYRDRFVFSKFLGRDE